MQIEWNVIHLLRPVYLLCSGKALRINTALIFCFFLLHLLIQNMFHLNDPWVSEVTGLLAGRRDSFNWQNANCFRK